MTPTKSALVATKALNPYDKEYTKNNLRSVTERISPLKTAVVAVEITVVDNTVVIADTVVDDTFVDDTVVVETTVVPKIIDATNLFHETASVDVSASCIITGPIASNSERPRRVSRPSKNAAKPNINPTIDQATPDEDTPLPTRIPAKRVANALLETIKKPPLLSCELSSVIPVSASPNVRRSSRRFSET